jgi:hypothetical protein
MGTKVDLKRLADTLEEYAYAYLMTCDPQGRPHAVAVHPTLLDSQLHVDGVGWRSRANAQASTVVTLVYPPVTEGGYSLIVDGTSSLTEDGLAVTPTVGVLYRPPRPDAPTSDTGCASDCQRLGLEFE